jgi:hypothetical protein
MTFFFLLIMLSFRSFSNHLQNNQSIIKDFRECGLEAVTMKLSFPNTSVATPLLPNEARRAESFEPSSTPSTPSTSSSSDTAIDRSVIPRMPWQDMAIGVGGCAARDVALHYICRWNHHRTMSLSENDKNMNLPILLPFSDNLDTDYSVGWPKLNDRTPSDHSNVNGGGGGGGLNHFIPSPSAAYSSSGQDPTVMQGRAQSTQSSATRYTNIGMGENAEKVLEEEVCDIFGD